MNWQGYYINLDRAIARRSSIESQLEGHKLAKHYKRFAAIDGRLLQKSSNLTSAEIGIYKSHLELIKRAALSNHITHVIEDDVWISSFLGPFIDGIAKDSSFSFDVLVTDTGFSCNIKRYQSYRQHLSSIPKNQFVDIQLLDISKAYLYGLTSYILSPLGAQKFLLAAEKEWLLGPRIPIDILLRQAAQSKLLNVLCSFPFLTWLNIETAQRTLSDRAQDQLTTTIRQLIRYPLYIERDANGYAEELLSKMAKLDLDCTETGLNKEVWTVAQWAEFLLKECRR